MFQTTNQHKSVDIGQYPVRLVGPRPLEGRGVLWTLGGCGGVGCGMYERSCELADEGHATLWLPAGACINVHVIFPFIRHATLL